VFRALKKEKKFRNAEEDKLIIDYTLQLPFFKKYTDSGLKEIPSECAKVLKPLHMNKGEIVFNISRFWRGGLEGFKKTKIIKSLQ